MDADERLSARQAGLLLIGIVVVVAAVRLWLVRGMVAPFIFVDELIYSELAKSIVAGDGFSIRGSAADGYSVTYPLLISPAWLLTDNGVTAYTIAKSINAVVMPLTAVPAYCLARRVVARPLALLAALTVVAVPSLAYTGTITTESLFYPVATGFALAFVRYLEHPRIGRLAVLGLAFLAAYLTRSQAVSFLPAIVTAPLVLIACTGRVADLRRYRALYVSFVVLATLVVVGQLARGRSPFDLLGTYSVVGEQRYELRHVLSFWLWHVEELLVYLAVVPVAAAAVLLARARSLPLSIQTHIAATVSLAFWSTLAVAMFTSRFVTDRVQDRYLFFLTPLFVVCLVAWVGVGAPRPRLVAPLTGAAALMLVALFPYGRFVAEPAKSDTLGLIPLWAFGEHLLAGSWWLTVSVATVALLLSFLLVPRRAAVALPLVVLSLFVVFSRPVWTSDKGFLVAGKGTLRQGIADTSRTWIDDAVRGRGEVVALWTEGADRFTVQLNEFFSESVGRVFYTERPTPGDLFEVPVSVDLDLVPTAPDGVFNLPNDGVVQAPFALLDSSVEANGTVIARSKVLGMTLWRLDGPLADLTSVRGVYPYPDTWSGPTVVWRRVVCAPGNLRVTVHSDPQLFRGTQTIEVRTLGEDGTAVTVVKRFSVTTDRSTFAVPVAPDAQGVCRVRFVVTPTANPAEVQPGSDDDRVLGMHFDLFEYEPAR